MISSPVLAALAIASASFSPLSLERIHSDPPLEGTPPSQPSLSPSGRTLAFLKANPNDSEVLDLWGVALPDGKPALLVATADLLAGATQQLTEQEKMALERKRITKRGITSYSWCGDAGTSLLFPLSGDLYFVTLQDGKPPLVRRLTTDEAPELVPQCNGKGDRVVFTKGGNVVALDLRTRKAKVLTRGASPTRSFGLAEFVAEEEMDRHEGTWWSPDGKRLLVFEVDESRVGVKRRAQIFADHTEMTEQRYPAAGERNAVVKAHLIDVATGRDTLVKTPGADGYLPRAGFFQDGTPWLQWQSRDQKTLRLFAINPRGVLSQILEDSDDAWVELHDDLRDLGDNKLLWSSEASGRRQLEIVDRKTGARRTFTSAPEPVDGVLAVDATRETVFFSAFLDRGRQLHVFSQKVGGGAAIQLTTQEGWHAARFDDVGSFFLDGFSTFGVPPTSTLRDRSGRSVLVLDDNPAAELRGLTVPTPQWLDVRAADGTTTLNGLLLPPTRPGWEKQGKAPVIAYLYGGPQSQTVAKRWMRLYPLFVHWTQQGYGVFLLDNRGMAGRDRAFGRGHKDGFADVPVADVKAGVAALAQVPWVDPSALGVFGWSGGGFLAARLVLDAHSPFRCAAAGAPATDWTLYDTHYTERYLGMPKNPDGTPSDRYAAANVVSRAGLLNRDLLILHGTADDNVLFEHSLRLIEALEKEGKLFDLAIYPGKAHGVSGKTAQLHVQKTVTAFFDRCLAP